MEGKKKFNDSNSSGFLTTTFRQGKVTALAEDQEPSLLPRRLKGLTPQSISIQLAKSHASLSHNHSQEAYTAGDKGGRSWICFGLNLKNIRLFSHSFNFFFSLYKTGENKLLRRTLTVSAETTHLSLSSRKKTFLNTHQWIMCQGATGGQSSWRNRRGLHCLQRWMTALQWDNVPQKWARWNLGNCFFDQTFWRSHLPSK